MAGITKEERERRKAAAKGAEENAENTDAESDAEEAEEKEYPKEKDEKKTASVKTKDASVIVYCKLPNGISFLVPGGGKVKLNGSNGSGAIAGYGRTEVDADDWNYIAKVYSGMKVFDKNNPIVFTAESEKKGDAAAKMYGGTVKTGLEQRNPKEIIKKAEREAGNKED